MLITVTLAGLAGCKCINNNKVFDTITDFLSIQDLKIVFVTDPKCIAEGTRHIKYLLEPIRTNSSVFLLLTRSV